MEKPRQDIRGWAVQAGKLSHPCSGGMSGPWGGGRKMVWEGGLSSSRLQEAAQILGPATARWLWSALGWRGDGRVVEGRKPPDIPGGVVRTKSPGSTLGLDPLAPPPSLPTSPGLVSGCKSWDCHFPSGGLPGFPLEPNYDRSH